MAYRFRAKDRSVECAVRRIAREQVDGAIAAIAAKDTALATHEVRRCCKKLRALIRLVRPGFADFAQENAAFREIAGGLASSRDAKVMLDTCDMLMLDAPEEVDRKSIRLLRKRLGEMHAAAVPGEGRHALEEARGRLGAAAVRIGQWELEEDGWDALEGGLLRIYRKGRADVRPLHLQSAPEEFHDMRKHVKYHWYHTRLFEPVWPGPMRQRARQLQRLGELLGVHHDLSVLSSHLSATAGPAADAAAETLLALGSVRQARIEAAALPLLRQVYAQSPKALGAYWHELWRIWRH